MSTPGVPLWGCPWHGLVKGYRLALANGDQIFYPQPKPDSTWEAGSTALIQHPLAPEVVRTPDEATADSFAGRQWWNKAILSGGSLHGHALGGWIYIDGDGASWLVKTTLSDNQVEGGLCDVTLKRFGVLGGRPEEYTYAVTVPDMGQATPALEGTAGYLRVTLYNTNKTGSAVAYEVAARMTDDQRGYWRWRPCGWLELALSGPGSECAAEFTTLKTRSQTLGAAQEVPMVLTPDFWYYEGTNGGSRLLRTPSGETTAILIIAHYSGTTSKSSGYEAYVVGIFYDDTGRHEITLSEQAETLIDSSVAEHSGDTEFGFNVPVTGTWTASNSLLTTLTLTYSIDGAAACTYSYSFESTYEAEVVVDGWDATETALVSEHYTPGATGSRTESTAFPWPESPGGVGFNLAGQLSAAHSPELIPNRMGGSGSSYDWDSGGGLNGLIIAPHRHSNSLFGMCSWLTGQLGVNAETHYLADLATPTGKVTLSEFQGGLSPVSTFCYGSWCPVTGQAVRDIVPICWV